MPEEELFWTDTLSRIILAPSELSIAEVKFARVALFIDSSCELSARIIPLPEEKAVIVNPAPLIESVEPLRVSGLLLLASPIFSFASRV